MVKSKRREIEIDDDWMTRGEEGRKRMGRPQGKEHATETDGLFKRAGNESTGARETPSDRLKDKMRGRLQDK